MARSTCSEKILVRVAPLLRAQVEAAAAEQGRSLSDIVRRALAEKFQAAEQSEGPRA